MSLKVNVRTSSSWRAHPGASWRGWASWARWTTVSLGLTLACHETKSGASAGATSGDVARSASSQVSETGSESNSVGGSTAPDADENGETRGADSGRDSNDPAPHASNGVSAGGDTQPGDTQRSDAQSSDPPSGAGSAPDVTSPTGPTVTVSAPATPDDFWRTWAEVVCAYRERCNGFPQSKTCQEYTLAKARSELRFVSPLLKLDLVAGFACLQAYAGPSCPPDSDLYNVGLGEECPRFARGSVTVDGACRHGAECADGSYCNTYDTCPGVCRPLAQLDQSCSDRPCAFGLSCAAGNVCVRDLDVDSACTPSQTDDVRCRLNALCHEGRCTTTLPYTRETGETCWMEDQCKGGARCVNGSCEALAELGQSCDDRACAPGLFCDERSRSCKPKKEPGATCSQETECLDSHCTGEICQALGGLGESCTRGQLCHSRSCVAERCELSQECAD